MHSPLPDSSALEAGIIEDEQPSRLSRVQDNVRNLLRASVFSSVRGSTVITEREEDVEDLLSHSIHARVVPEPEALPSESTETITTTTSTVEERYLPGILFPPTTYAQNVQEMAHQSTLFNTRAVAALNHPDLSDPSMALFLQQKTENRQRRAWKRSRNRKQRYASGRKRGGSQCLLCIISGLLLAAIVATYLTLATTTTDPSTAFHVLFILGILLATVIFAHTLVRTCMQKRAIPASPRVYVVTGGRPRRRHHRHHENHQHRHRQPRHQSTLSASSADFVPPTPIPVHVASDEVRPDSREAQPSAATEPTPAEWDKDLNDLPNPPPAYGRWRGSVRANPDLLHWQAIPSPLDPNVPDLPSPTYEQVVHEERTGPPSYVTRESPARRRDVQDGRPDLVQAQAVEPEMVEVRGVELAV